LAKNRDLRIFDKFDSQNPLISNRFDEPQPAFLPAIRQPGDAWSQTPLQPWQPHRALKQAPATKRRDQKI